MPQKTLFRTAALPAAIFGTILLGNLTAIDLAYAANPFTAKATTQDDVPGCLQVAANDTQGGDAKGAGDSAAGGKKATGGDAAPAGGQSGGSDDQGQGIKGMKDGKCGEGKCGGST